MKTIQAKGIILIEKFFAEERERESDIFVVNHYKWIDWNFNNSFFCIKLIYDPFCRLGTNELTCTNNIDLKFVSPLGFV